MENWRISEYCREVPDYTLPVSGKDSFPAHVPGCVQYDLMKQERLKNPYASTEAAFEAAWVAKSDWLYETSFQIPSENENYKSCFLKVWGIDTFSEIWLNGILLGETTSAYISYEFEVNPSLLQEGDNYLKIRVKAHERMIEDKVERAQCLKRGKATEGLLGKSLIRRYQRSFFTESSLLNIGTGVLGIGINRPIELVFCPEVYISDLVYRTDSLEKDANGRINVTLNKVTEETELMFRILDSEGKCVWQTSCKPETKEQEISVQISNPNLWWPKGYGQPYLYTLETEVTEHGVLSDRWEKKIGIRTVKLVQCTSEGKKTFYFEVNGQKIFIHGENYIPMDYIKVYGNPEQYKNLFLLLEMQNVNLVRIWGGGAVEDSFFFENCDKKGILIWHDLFLHSNVYPDYDVDFVETFSKETEGILKTVRSHPCIAVICGGNEQFEGWDEYGWQQELDSFYGSSLPLKVIPQLMEKVCPEIPYIYNSPYGGTYAQSPLEGDCHCWGNYYNASKDPLFVTETCWTSESYSRPETLKKYMDLDVDDFSELGWGEKWKERTSLSLIGRRHFSSYFDVRTLRDYLYGLELEEARADYHALNQFRFLDPSTNGIVYWSFNKGGPLFQFGCVDYDGRPMMSYYVIQRLYKPVVVFPYRDCKDVRVMLSNHSGVQAEVQVEAYCLTADGTILQKYESIVTCAAGELVVALNLQGLYQKVFSRSEESIFIRASMNGTVIAEDLLLFCPFNEFKPIKKAVSCSVKALGKNEWQLILQAEGIVQMLEVESDQKIVCEDNYFPMMPGEKKKIRIVVMEETDVKTQPTLFIRQFNDSYKETILLEE